MSIVNNTAVESRPIKWLVEELRKSNLFVDDSFQRNYVWINKDRISLIETILLGYSIPEIYLWESDTDPDSGETRYSIIDGQQRIKTISQFINGDLKLTDSGLEFKTAPYRGKRFDELTNEEKSAVWSYKVSIRFVNKSVTRDDIIKMFLRLNKTSNALNPQELRHAEFHGEFLNASVKVASLPHWKKWATFSDMELRRMGDVQFASTLLIFARSGFEDETTQSSINRYYDLLNENYPGKDKDIEAVIETLDYIDKLIAVQPEIKDLLRKKTHAYTIFTLADSLKKSQQTIKDSAAKLICWYEWQESDSQVDKAYVEAAEEYRRLTLEGVQKKSNRYRRYEILSKYMGI